MPADNSPTSVCTFGIRIDVYWHLCTEQAEHIDSMVDELFSSISGPGRVWSPEAKSMVRAEFRSRMKTAARGELVPVKHVKSVGRGRREYIFEIRWSSISVTEMNDGAKRFKDIEVRLLHTEPAEVNVAIVGLHTHEKKIYPDDPRRTHQEQNAEVDVAISHFYDGLPTLWGIK